MKISILSKPNSFFSKSSIKRVLRKFTGKISGPTSVEESLRRGLKKLNDIEYNFNPSTRNIYENVVVLQGVDTLKYALRLKKEGKIKNIFAGPNITMLPKSNDAILKNSNVNKIIVPSNWVKDMYIADSPEIKNKIEVWPAGVENTNEVSTKNGGFIVYFKNAPVELLEYVKFILKNKNIDYDILKYGNYKKQEYFDLLKDAKGAIFLSPSESQGLSLQEAWIRNVPTLAWDSGVAKDKNLIWHAEKISAPYMTGETGMFFKNKDDFENKLNLFLSTSFNPRKYCLENLTDEISAKKLLEIIKNNENIH